MVPVGSLKVPVGSLVLPGCALHVAVCSFILMLVGALHPGWLDCP